MLVDHLYDELVDSLSDFKTLLTKPSTRSPEVIWQLVAIANALAVAIQAEEYGQTEKIPEHLWGISDNIKQQLKQFQRGDIVKFKDPTQPSEHSEEGWISITDKLPPLATEVLCWCDGVWTISSLVATIDGFAWSGGNKVTYWKPISLDSPTSVFK